MSAEETTEKRPRWIYSVLPKWLEFSGLRQAFGAQKAFASVFIALVKWDHQLDGDKMLRRRRGDGWRTFAVGHWDVAEMANVNKRVVGRAAKALDALGLLNEYVPGKPREWSHFQVNRERLLALFKYVAPQRRKVHGGIQNATGQDGALRPTVVYGNATPPERVIVPADEMLELWKERPEKEKRPDPERAAEILGIDHL